MKVRVKKSFTYSKDGVNALQAEPGQVIEDFPDSEYEGCCAAGLVEADKEPNGAGKSQEGKKETEAPEKKTEADPNGSQTGKEKSVASLPAAQAPKQSQKKSGGTTKTAK